MEIAKLVHIIKNLAHQSKPFQIVLHLGLKSNIRVHAALFQVGKDILDEQLQQVINFPVIPQLVCVLELHYRLLHISHGLHGFRAQPHLGLMLDPELVLYPHADLIEALDAVNENF